MSELRNHEICRGMALLRKATRSHPRGVQGRSRSPEAAQRVHMHLNEVHHWQRTHTFGTDEVDVGERRTR